MGSQNDSIKKVKMTLYRCQPKTTLLNGSSWGQKATSFKEAPYSYPYFWIFRRYVRINAYVTFFSTWHENIASMEYIEAIFSFISSAVKAK